MTLNVVMLHHHMDPITFTCDCCNEHDIPGRDLADIDGGGYFREEINERYGKHSMICVDCAAEMVICDKCAKATPDHEVEMVGDWWLCGECACQEQDADYWRNEEIEYEV